MKKIILGFTKIAVSVSLLWYLISIVDIDATIDRLKDVDPHFVVIAFILLIVQVALSSSKWKLILQSDGLNVPFLFLLKTYFIGNFLGLFLPSSFGGDIYRVYALSSTNKRVAKTTSSVLFDRLTGLYALLTIALLAYVSLPGANYDLALILLYISGFAIFFLVTSKQTIHILENSGRSITRHLSTLLTSFRAYLLDIRNFWKILVIALLFQFMIVVINKLYTLALSIDIPFSMLLVIVPLVYLTEVLPISINGAGVRDSAFVFFFVSIGHTKEEGLAIGILVLAMRYVSGLLGGLVLAGTMVRRHLVRRAQ